MSAPRCACKLHGELVCPNEVVVRCYVCGAPLCNDCTTDVLTDAGFTRICTPQMTDELCMMALKYRKAYSQAATQ